MPYMIQYSGFSKQINRLHFHDQLGDPVPVTDISVEVVFFFPPSP